MDQCSEIDMRIIQGMAGLVPQSLKMHPVLGIDSDNNSLTLSSRASSAENDSYSPVTQDTPHLEENESVGFWPSLRGIAQSFVENYAKELAPEDYSAFKPIPVDPKVMYDDSLDDVDGSSESSDSEEEQPALSTLIPYGANSLVQLAVTKDIHDVSQKYMATKPTTIPEFSRTRGKNLATLDVNPKMFDCESMSSGAKTVRTEMYHEYANNKELIAKFEFARAIEEDLGTFFTRIENQLVSIDAMDSNKVLEQVKEIHDEVQIKSVQLKDFARLLQESTLDLKKAAKRLEMNVYHECPSPFQNSYVNNLEKNRLEVYYDAVQIMDEYDRLLAIEDISEGHRRKLMAEKKELWREFRQWAASDSKNIATRTAKTYSFFFRTPRVSLFTT
ncbi:uncharacterized protein V1513DRAFT_442651 [Lipomyces chichibuensis]|uniref:uncharacterized protein n=1 Tax=Lipomyces chichibuensis TaxID=1546026 RepID=UPI003343029B